jgi:hypothetical protein
VFGSFFVLKMEAVGCLVLFCFCRVALVIRHIVFRNLFMLLSSEKNYIDDKRGLFVSV